MTEASPFASPEQRPFTSSEPKKSESTSNKEKKNNKKDKNDTPEKRAERAQKAKDVEREFQEAERGHQLQKDLAAERARNFLLSTGYDADEVEKLSTKDLRNHVRFYTASGAATLEDLPDNVKEEVGGRREETGGRAEERQETQRVMGGKGASEYPSPTLVPGTPEIGQFKRQEIENLFQSVEETYEQNKDQADVAATLQVAGVDRLTQFANGTFLEVAAVREKLDEKVKQAVTADEQRDFQQKYGQLYMVAQEQMNNLINRYEDQFHPDDIVLESQNVAGRLRIYGRAEADKFAEKRELARDALGTPDEFKGIRKYRFDRANESLQGAIKEDFMASPADTPEKIIEKLLERLDRFDQSTDTYRESDPTNTVPAFIRSIADVNLREKLNQIYAVRNTLHQIEVVNSLLGGNIEAQAKGWTNLGQKVKTVINPQTGEKLEVWVSNLGEVLDRYPGAARAYAQFLVEADIQLDEVERKIAEFRKTHPKFTHQDAAQLKREVDWVNRLMSYSTEAKQKAIRDVARKLGMDPQRDKATLELSYRLYRLYAPGIFEKTWYFEKDPSDKWENGSPYRRNNYDFEVLDNKSPYQINLLQNPIGWMVKEARGKPSMVKSFEKIFGPEVFPHLKIGTRMLRKMVVGATEEQYRKAVGDVREERESQVGANSSFMEKVGLAEDGKVNGDDLTWRGRLESITGADWRDDVLDDSLKELEFYKALQQHFQKMNDESLEGLIKALPSGKEFRWQNALMVKEMIRNYVENRRKYDKKIYDRHDDFSTIEGERLVNKMAASDYISKKDANKLKHELFGIGTGSLRIPGYAPVRFVRRLGEGLGGIIMSPGFWTGVVLSWVGAFFVQGKNQVGEQLKGQTGSR